jgi:hypothetical protein
MESRLFPFVRIGAVGWEQCADVLDVDDSLVLFARSSQQAVHSAEISKTNALVPTGDGKPALSLPIIVGRRVTGVALYGSHRSGEPLDAEEEDLLTRLTHAASTAYEHLRVQELEERVTELQGQRLAPVSGA